LLAAFGASFSDLDYRAAGAEIVSGCAADVLGACGASPLKTAVILCDPTLIGAVGRLIDSSHAA